MNSRIINTFPWGLHFNHTLEPLNPGYKYTGVSVNSKSVSSNVNANEEFLRRKRIKIFDTNVPDLIPMDIVLEEEEEEEQGLVKQQRTLPPLRMEIDTDTASESESEDIPPMPVLRRQTTCWVNEQGLTVYNGCPFGNRLMNK
jgi:hypothetical protein